MKTKKKKTKKGLTLLELIISASIASIVILAVVAVFSAVVKNRNNVKNIQQSMENTRSAVEYMSKSLRMGCNIKLGDGSAFEGEYDSIFFGNQSTGKCEKFAFAGGKITKYDCGDPAVGADLCDKGASPGCNYATCGSGMDITPADLQGAKFYVKKNQSSSHQIPIITIRIRTADKIMQTSISTRDYGDVEVR
jgi:hypothetical protein